MTPLEPMSIQTTSRIRHRRPRFSWRCLPAAILLAMVAAPCAAQLEWTGQTMGTVQWSVKINRLPTGRTADTVRARIESELDEVNRLMSTYRADSDVSRFSAYDGTDWFPVSLATATVVAKAQEISQLSDGAFDITVSPLVNLWHFGPERHDPDEFPTDLQIRTRMEWVGYQKLHVRLAPPALQKDHPKLSIDLSAIAKGYAVDAVGRGLLDLEIEQFLVEVGGELTARGAKDSGVPWKVGIERPAEGQRAFDYVVELRDRSLATSGDYRNFFRINGKRYSHTIDPATGKPIENSMASASVIAPDCLTADAMATAVMVLGAERGRTLCAELKLPLMTLEHNRDKIRQWASSDFPLAETQPVGSLWSTVVFSAVFFGLAIAVMAVGAMFGRRPISGSCGGLANTTDAAGNIACSLCRNPSTECREKGALAGNDSNHESA